MLLRARMHGASMGDPGRRHRGIFKRMGRAFSLRNVRKGLGFAAPFMPFGVGLAATMIAGRTSHRRALAKIGMMT